MSAGEFLQWLRTFRWADMTGNTDHDMLGRNAPQLTSPTNLRTGEAWFTGQDYLKQGHRADWHGVHPVMQFFAAKLIEAARRQRVPLYVHTALRTKNEQEALYDRGRSQARWPDAPHCRGGAVDIVHSRYHWEMGRDEWRWIFAQGRVILERHNLPIQWGGHWDFYDPAHWQLADWRDLPVVDVRAGHQPVQQTPRYILRNGAGRLSNARLRATLS